RGKCVDFSSVFVALSRTAGVPAREILGTRISKNGDITGAYHCRAEFYLPNYGWVPVDPSDVAKLMLNENLNINDSKVIEARDYFFGAQTETYIDLSTGRDVVLNPMQEEGPLNYFIYPYAEINGVSLNFVSQEYLKYIVTFQEK
ncbi:MAG: transglutaminase, partial [Thermoplasmata archaeon M9B1D]